MEQNKFLDGMDDDGRVQVAARVGLVLTDEATAAADRRAAELLAHDLAKDAIEKVRVALSEAVKHATDLPKPLARVLAHDVDPVACPFLEVTEIFSDADWQSLILTISRSARVAVARRQAMTDTLALHLSEVGDSVVAETLLENAATPMTPAVCDTLLDRFPSEIWVLDKMAERDDLLVEVVTKLTVMVSAAAREKLAKTYGGAETAAVADEADLRAILKTVGGMTVKELIAAAETLHGQGKLTPVLLRAAARDRQMGFLEAALSVITQRSIEHVRSVLERADSGTVTSLLEKAGVPAEMFDDLWAEIGAARREKQC